MKLPAPAARALSRAALAVAALLASAAPALAFNFADVAVRAKQLAAEPYKKTDVRLPKELVDIGYDQYKEIHFKPERAHWHAEKLPFELQFFHQGLYYDRPVKISEVAGNSVREIRFNARDFDYGALKVDASKLADIGFAGFRVHYPINGTKAKEEFLVFLGASYFRGVAKGQRYGLSARGLAVDTGLISGEEFPRFTDFWIVRPEPGAKELTVYALMNSKRMTGAYRFVLKPGTETVMETKGRVFLRENVTKLGLAPLTSMFFYGENQPTDRDDYRPEAHDSDGLLIASGTGEWIWRPLLDPKRLLVTSFAMSNPQGFGLMQRDRRFDHYEDLDYRYELRPSAWVEPKGNWGPGRVELVQIPTTDETNDNIVAYWVPDNPPGPDGLDFEYRLLWQGDKDRRPPLSWVTQTLRGKPFQNKPDDSLGYVIDFEGPALAKLGADARVEGIVSVDGNGELLERRTVRNDATGGWRLMLRLRRVDADKPVELRAYLRGDNATLSETWSYILPPG